MARTEIQGHQIKDDSLTGEDIDESTLGPAIMSGSVSGGYITQVLNGEGSAGHGLLIRSYGNGSSTYLLDVTAREGKTVLRADGDGHVGVGNHGNSLPAALSVKQYSSSPIVNVKDSSDNAILKIDGDAKLMIADNLYHSGDLDTYVGFPGANEVNLVAGGHSFLKCDGDILINNANENRDTKIMADDGNVVLHVDAGTNKVGIGTTSPAETLDVTGIAKATSVRTGLIEYTDGDDAITIEDGGYLKFHAGIKYARGVLVSSTDSPAEVGGWIKFATLDVPGTSNLDTAASSFLVTFAGMESSNNRALDGIFMVHAKFTVNTGGDAEGGSDYYEHEGTKLYCEPLNADKLSANGATDFDPATDLIMITTNTDSTPVVDLYIKANAKDKHCFVTHLGGTGQTGTFDTDAGWTINTGQSWVTTEPAAPGGSAKITGTWVSKVFSNLRVSGLTYDAAADPTITFSEGGTEKGTIGINSSDNILIENKTINKHIVFKVNDQGVVREGFRINGTVPEVVVNEGSDSLVDFRVESDNQTHMLFVDGSADRVGINTASPSSELEVVGKIVTDKINTKAFGVGVRDVNSTSSVQDTDYCLRCIQMSAITITLPAKSSSAGRVLVFKDVLGNAASNNITIDGDGSDQIDGAATFVLNQNRQSLTIVCDGINGWMITGMYIP